MKSYRCVFSYTGGNTTIDIAAADGEQALNAAASEINAGDYDGVEIWDSDMLVIKRTTPRPWDRLGAPSKDSMAEDRMAEDSVAEGNVAAADRPAGLPRRAPTLFVSSLRALGAKTGWQKIVSRRTKG